MFDATINGRKLKILNVIDEYSKLCLATICSRCITASDVLSVIRKLVAVYGKPEHLRSDNGTEFTAKIIKEGLKKNKIDTIYIEPRSPWQNAYVESFNSIVRDSVFESERSSSFYG